MINDSVKREHSQIYLSYAERRKLRRSQCLNTAVSCWLLAKVKTSKTFLPLNSQFTILNFKRCEASYLGIVKDLQQLYLEEVTRINLEVQRRHFKLSIILFFGILSDLFSPWQY
jgi:hypothetical protein